jgi:mRNA-degrading endonuclease RelE of RelBE toxin-antitoxin system
MKLLQEKEKDKPCNLFWMNYNIIISETFKKECKPLFKKYPSLKNDLEKLLADLKENPNLGIDLGGGIRKIRLNIKSKGKGTAGGARVITYETLINIDNSLLTLLSIYNKGEFDSIDIALLKKSLGI